MRFIHIAALALVFPVASSAQGSVSNQGFGYPLGGLSGAAAALGGANGEIDANSAINPAAITRSNRFSVMLRFEPEMRETKLGGGSANSTVMRFPAFQATGAYGRFVGAIGVTTMLDRSWRNQYTDSLIIGGEPIGSVLQIGSEGAMSDARAAVGYVVNPRLQVGFAMHALTGENRTVFLRQFDPASGVSSISQSNSFGFTGTAYSLGLSGEPFKDLIVSASARFGQDMKLELQGTELGSASVPSRAGVGVTYFGISGLALFGRVDQTKWSNLRGLGSDSVSIFDGTEFAIGAEALGPRVLGASSAIRAGFRSRNLPFGVNGSDVQERGFAVGIGLPVSRGRGQIDLGAQRLRRNVSGIEENAWLLSLGFGIRP
jgi:hypothetical protein